MGPRFTVEIFLKWNQLLNSANSRNLISVSYARGSRFEYSNPFIFEKKGKKWFWWKHSVKTSEAIETLCSGGSRIFLGGGANPHLGGHRDTILLKFPENCMKSRKIWSLGGRSGCQRQWAVMLISVYFKIIHLKM